MKIESLAVRPDRAGRYCVRLESGEELRLYRQTIEDFGLCAGIDLPETRLEILRESAGLMSAKMRAVRIVSATNVSRQDLQQRLIRKGENQAQAAVAWMEEMQLLDDAKTARQIAENCAARGYGVARAKQMLYEKKIPKEYWGDALADYPDQSEKIRAFLCARLEGDDQQKMRQAVHALLRRGHSYGQIRHVLNELDAEDFLEEN